MAIKYSTGRGTRLRHSTAMEWEDLEKIKKKYGPIKHSTGEAATVRHSTGTEFDFRFLYMREQDENRKAKRVGIRSKPPAEGDEHLDFFQRALGAQRVKEAKGGRGSK